MSGNDVVITGIGIVSSLGLGVDDHWNAVSEAKPLAKTDSQTFSPYTVHPLPEIDWSQQIPKRGDQRQMETWQRLGTYAAGLALDDSGMKGDEALVSSMDMVVAAGGGERDLEVDQAILDASLERNDREVLLNEKLTTELRPTLFLAQLSNLLAGNISIVHKVTGSSRTFMGEEGAGVSAVETAAARIASGQSSHLLVGAAFQTEHPDMLLAYELGNYLQHDGWSPVWARDEAHGGGIVTGSGAAFLVLESREHAERRGRQAYARISRVVSGRNRRDSSFAEKLSGLAEKALGDSAPDLILSGASGAHAATRAERDALDKLDAPLRGMSSLSGHLKEAQFPFAVALGAMSLHRKATPSPFAPDHGEAAASAEPSHVLATAIGYHRFEGMALLEQA
ncbi:beta-ketoacyl-ACP synthase [Nitratireductor basaltis]|uniref:3-oxoacyl-(Acyl carrier protein) synthase II n=1 Tax=Nitratireductor basaltis TaxID=472175 RepID=A0A084UA22_9HYPH|nr:beta-ketoacyl-ACP synthase [Nitratireductor basaltis]KFB09808.1 3-oxoacyl-(Acyl carrier protein) synthase II [Nitratireductor basaltis]